MANGIVNRLYRAFKTFDQAVDILLGRSLPPGHLLAIDCNALSRVQPTIIPGRSLKDVLKDTMLWAVPKKRRTIEKRLCRRFGIPEYHWKPHVPKTNIIMCRKCGRDHEVHTLCGHCYEIVKLETKEMQKAIKDSLDLAPIEQEVIVLYEGEKENLRDNFWKKQRIVELPKKRPEWFNANLLQPTTGEPTELENKQPEDDLLSSKRTEGN